MTFKKVNPLEELGKLRKDEECNKYIEQFEKEYDEKTLKMIEERNKKDDDIRYTSDDVIKMRKNNK